MNEKDMRIFIKKITIHDFRAFSGKNPDGSSKIYEIELGEHITCISGHNGIGKSTILAMLSNCGELKKRDGILLNGDQFSGEYSSIIKYDKEYDTTGEKCSIFFRTPDNTTDTSGFRLPKILNFRAAVQQDGTRYRLLPKKTEERQTESKIEWPTYYLGLSRLYPIGESENVDISGLRIDTTIKEEMFRAYSHILNANIADNIDSSFISPSDAKKKKGVGIKTDKYGVLSNSSGQDNLGQILMTVFSFQNLKNTLEKKENYWHDGGILLIDEIDAALHPAAQNKLFRFLYKKSQELNLQIVFTTHSLSLLEYITKAHTLNTHNKSLVVQYLTSGRGDVEILKNPTIERIRRDLLILTGETKENPKIDILTEDDVGRWFLEKIIDRSNLDMKLNFIDCTFGCGEIAKLVSGSKIFNNIIVVLDPDISSQQSRQDVENNLKKGNGYWALKNPVERDGRCIFALPGDKPIETMLWEYVNASPENHKMYFDQALEEEGIYKRNLIDEQINELTKQKEWFYKNKYIMDTVLCYWIDDNKDIINDFIKNFKCEYNKIARKIGIDKIQ